MGPEMLCCRAARKYQRWLFGFVCLIFLCLFLIKWPSEPVRVFRPWIDTNQIDADVLVKFKDFKHGYQIYSSRHRDLCKGKRALVLVASSPANAKRRKEARNSWAKKENIPSDYIVQFFIGAQSTYDTEVDLYVEKHDSDDLLRYSLPDTYENLVFKTHAMLWWQREFCPDVKYLIKVDDDTVVDLKRLDHFIRNDFQARADIEKPAFYCKAYSGASPYRNPFSKWHVSRLIYADNTFPTYCNGNIYLMTGPTVERLLSTTEEINLVHIEDVVFTGILPGRLNITVHSSDVFCNKQSVPDTKCLNDIVPFHTTQCDVSEKRIAQTYNDLQNIKCSNLSALRNSSFLPTLFVLIVFVCINLLSS